MKLAISNIAWQPGGDGEKAPDIADEVMYEALKNMGYKGVEIAPTRIFPVAPYEKLGEGKTFAQKLKEKYNLVIPSMQSIWFGRREMLFGHLEERKRLLDYTKKAMDFAVAVGCRNLVFGSPKNRVLPDPAERKQGVTFFKELGSYGKERGVTLAMEANPTMYGTNFINTTPEAIQLVQEVEEEGFGLNLDVGTMIANRESLESIERWGDCISHVHISEPGLAPICITSFHRELAAMLREMEYAHFISIEMGKGCEQSRIMEIMEAVKEVFGK